MKIENCGYFDKKRVFFYKKFARTCVCENNFVSLHPHFVFMEELIRHTGVVMSVNGDTAHVRIVQTSACQACKAKSMCMSSESREKEMDALMTEPMGVGDQVEVEVRERLAWKAVLLAYILPFIAMIAVMVTLNYLTDWSEAIVGTLSLSSIALYYIVLGAFKHRLQKEFSFTARRL